ncbi:MAG: hypothetical protein GY820_17090 [Gammaproteobacteria bacterium]|nr:hypothetical protein [Gammaproteobacteria bacterium]
MENRVKVTHKQTGRTLIVGESEALDLDSRVWDKVWIATGSSLKRAKVEVIGMILTDNRKGTYDLTRLTTKNYWRVLKGLQLTQ